MRKIQLVLVAAVAALMLGAVASSAEAVELEGPKFEAEHYPAHLVATSSADVWTMFGLNIECTNNTFTGTLSGEASSLNITPTIDSCHPFGVFPASVTTSPNNYTFHSNGTLDITSPITMNVYESATKQEERKPMCVMTILAQNGLSAVKYANDGDGTMTVSGTVGGIAVTQMRNSIFCPSGKTGTATYAIQSGGITFSATYGGSFDRISLN